MLCSPTFLAVHIFVVVALFSYYFPYKFRLSPLTAAKKHENVLECATNALQFAVRRALRSYHSACCCVERLFFPLCRFFFSLFGNLKPENCEHRQTIFFIHFSSFVYSTFSTASPSCRLRREKKSGLLAKIVILCFSSEIRAH